MQLTDELIFEIERAVIYAARGILGYRSTMTYTDHRDRLYNGCDYLDEIKQSMLLKILEDKGGRFEKAFISSKKGFMNLVMKAARDLTKNYLRNAREVPCSQIDGYFSEGNDDDYDQNP